jgi:hypothetical protein
MTITIRIADKRIGAHALTVVKRTTARASARLR